MNIIIFFSHSSSLTHRFILHAYFYIILTEVITFLIRKDWSKVFLHTLLHKNVLRINEHFLILKFQQKVLMILEDTYFEVKNATAFVGPSALQTLGLQTNVSAN